MLGALRFGALRFGPLSWRASHYSVTQHMNNMTTNGSGLLKFHNIYRRNALTNNTRTL